MVKKVIGLLLALWGGGLLVKGFFVHPTIFAQIEFYGLTAYMAGQLIALIFGLVILIFGIKWLVGRSKNGKSEEGQESVQ